LKARKVIFVTDFKADFDLQIKMRQFSTTMLLNDPVKQLPKIISYAYRIQISESLDLHLFSVEY